jgi:hypothetical protein
MKGSSVAAKSTSVYSSTCNRVKAGPCVTGSIGRPERR